MEEDLIKHFNLGGDGIWDVGYEEGRILRLELNDGGVSCFVS